MKCPSCSSEMRSGKVRVVSSITGLFLGAGNLMGFFQHLWFFPSGGGSHETVRKSMRNQAALHCPQCQTVVLPGGSAS